MHDIIHIMGSSDMAAPSWALISLRVLSLLTIACTILYYSEFVRRWRRHMAEIIESTTPFRQANKKGSNPLPRITTQFDGDSLPWPNFSDLQKFQISPDALESQWLDHPAPVELGRITAHCPSEVVDIIERSVQKETYAPRVQELDAAAAGVVVVVEEASDPDPQTSSTRSADDDADDDAVSVVTTNTSGRSSVSESTPSSNAGAPSRKQKSGPISWLAVKGSKVGSDRVRDFLKHKPSRSLLATGTSECTSCLEDFSINNLILLQCQHGYCGKCFVQLVHTAIRAEEYFPPKCCLAPIPMEIIFKHVKPDVAKLYKLKAREYALPVSDRWYCPAADCGSWISSKDIKPHSATQRCSRCRTSVCSICRGLAHETDECPQDTGLTATLAAAELQGWRRCYNCHALVELAQGCLHITCKCKAEFCYVCGARWQTCSCNGDDLQRRRSNLAQLRSARDASERASQQEEREIEDAIAAVEALERREEEERIQAEARRLREEAVRRRREEELAETSRLAGIADRIAHLRSVLMTINCMQGQHILQRQRDQMMRIQNETSTLERDLQTHRELLEKQFEGNLKMRLDALDGSQAAEFKSMREDHIEEEDEIIVKMSRLLKGCKNVEEREVSIMKHLRETHEKEENDLACKHRTEVADLVFQGSLERKGLKAGLSTRQQACLKQSNDTYQAFVQSTQFEAAWVKGAFAKRFELLQAFREELQRGSQPVAELVVVAPSPVPVAAPQMGS